MSLNLKSISLIISNFRKNIMHRKHFYVHRNNYCSHGISSDKNKIEDLFFNPEVQRILKKITGLDYDKIFARKPDKILSNKYIFATERHLKKLQEKTAIKAREKLQMPPVMEIRKPISEILSKNPELQGYLKHTLVFIDTSSEFSSRDRIITVREIDGTLRKASWEERDRMNQIFFPIHGRHLEVPELFNSPNLERLLEEGSYVFVLDSVCIQFEPDHPEYHRVTKATYEHVKQMKKFDILRSTRHFGPMAFYLAYNKDIDLLLIDMIEKQLISDASDTIKLFCILHPEIKNSMKVDEVDEIDIVQDYIKTHATKKADLELRLQTFLEQHQAHQEEAFVNS